LYVLNIPAGDGSWIYDYEAPKAIALSVAKDNSIWIISKDGEIFRNLN
jgi:hypothetical protein